MFGAMLSPASSYCGSDPTLEETPIKSIARLVIAVVAVMFAVATLCPAQNVKPTDLQGGGVQWQEDRDEGQGRGRLPPAHLSTHAFFLSGGVVETREFSGTGLAYSWVESASKPKEPPPDSIRTIECRLLLGTLRTSTLSRPCCANF